MNTQTFEIGIQASVMLAALFWLDMLPVESLAAVAKALLAWGAFSTLLVASAGAWVAVRRGAARRPVPVRR
jgi:hypothetical protein